MGFESIVAYVIMFSLGMSAVVGMVYYYKDYVYRTTSSLDDRQEFLANKGDSDIEITSVSYEGSPEMTLILTSQSDFNDGIFDQTNNTLEPDNLTLELNGANYYEYGNWTSDIIDLGQHVNFTNIFFQVDARPSTDGGIQIRTAKTEPELIGNFIGPDGTTDTFYIVNDDPINDVHDGDVVLQIRVYLNTTDNTQTFALQELNITYTWLYDVLNITILNDGKIKLDDDYLEIFLGADRVTRDYDNITKIVVESTDIENPGLWDPQELININFPINLTPGRNILKIVNEFSNSDYYAFTI